MFSPFLGKSFIKLSADTPEQLRRCDVFRIMDNAHDNMNPVDFAEFVAWLRDVVRPELLAEINDVQTELCGVSS